MNTHFPTTVFPDTNAILHYPQIADTDWCRLLGAPLVKVIICMQVVRELDDIKRDPHYAKRAKRAIREIDRLRQTNEVRKDVSLELLQDEPKASEFPDSLDPERKDDRIIAAVLAFARSHPEEAVVVVSEDYGMKLRCESHRLVTVGPDQGTRLDDPSDEKTKKKSPNLAGDSRNSKCVQLRR
jgi:predicted ribonuclease YlaK